MPRYDQKSRIESAPTLVRDAIRAELQKPVDERMTLRAMGHKWGFSKSTLSRYKMKLERDTIKNWRLSAITKIEMRNCCVIVKWPDGTCCVSTIFGRSAQAVTHHAVGRVIPESEIAPHDIRIEIRYKKGIVGNPLALR